MAAGRPYEYDFAMCVEICEHVASGMSIRKALMQSNKYPTWETFRKWRRDNEELMALYTWARQDKSESVEFQFDNTISDLENGTIDPATARVILDALKWKMAKYYPKMFGDKSQVDVTSGGDKITWNEVRTYDKPESE